MNLKETQHNKSVETRVAEFRRLIDAGKIPKADIDGFNKSQDAAEMAHGMMKNLCGLVFSDTENAFFKARGIADELVCSMFLTLGREEAQKIVDRMSEQLAMFKDD